MISNLCRNAFHLTQKRPFIVDGLKQLKGNLTGVEIGTYRGKFAKAILKNIKINKLYLIDPFQNFQDYTDFNPMPLDKAESDAHLRLNKFENVVWIKKKSSEAVKEVEDNLDFVYIDGNHSYRNVKEDIELYYSKIKSYGIIGGHDFFNGHCSEHDGVIKAVIEFVVKNKLKLYAQAPDWWVIKEKK